MYTWVIDNKPSIYFGDDQIYPFCLKIKNVYIIMRKQLP